LANDTLERCVTQRCYLLDSTGRIFDRRFVECDDQAAALAQAGAMLAESDVAAGIEVWDDAYMVQRLKKLEA
jgi:hypothetical protein